MKGCKTLDYDIGFAGNNITYMKLVTDQILSR